MKLAEQRQMRQHRHSRYNSTGSTNGGGFWRLLTCTEASMEDQLEAGVKKRHSGKQAERQQNEDTDYDEEAVIDEVKQQDDDKDKDTVTDLPKQQQHKTSKNSKRKECSPSLSQEDRVSQSKDSFWQKIFRGSAGDDCASAAQRSKSPYVGGRRKRRKRLVVAMLEDDDGATNDLKTTATSDNIAADANIPTAQANPEAKDSEAVQRRTMRDKKNIQRILQKLSDSLEQPAAQRPIDPSTPTTAASALCSTAAAPQTSASALGTAETNVTQTAPQQPPQQPLQEPPQQPPCSNTQYPYPHQPYQQPQQPAPPATQPTEFVSSDSSYQQLHTQVLPLLPQPQQHYQHQHQPPAAYAVALPPGLGLLPPPLPPLRSAAPHQFAASQCMTPPRPSQAQEQQPAPSQHPPVPPQQLMNTAPPPATKTSFSGFVASQSVMEQQHTSTVNRCRRGYRLFRRIFSAADNYYAVPFPPLETLCFKEDDDDQWEDLEIYVASHKGLVSLKPQQQNNTKSSDMERHQKGAARVNYLNLAAERLKQRPQQQQQQQQQRQQIPECQQLQLRKPESNNGKQQNDSSQRIARKMLQNQALRARGAADPKGRCTSLQNQAQSQKSIQPVQQAYQRFQQPARNRRANQLNPGRALSQLNSTATLDSDVNNNRRTQVIASQVPSYMRPYSPTLRKGSGASGAGSGCGGSGEGGGEGGGGGSGEGGGGAGGGGGCGGGGDGGVDGGGVNSGARCARVSNRLPSVYGKKSKQGVAGGSAV